MGCVLGLHALAESVRGRATKETAKEADNGSKVEVRIVENKDDDNLNNKKQSSENELKVESSKHLSKVTAVTLHNPNPASSSQVDFFRMLDEKIDQGDGQLSSNGDVVEASSIETERPRESFEHVLKKKKKKKNDDDDDTDVEKTNNSDTGSKKLFWLPKD